MKVLTLSSALVAVAAILAPPAAAQAGVPCWQKVINDWWDNARVDNVYPVRCYREALARLPEDMQAYSSAPDDIERALRNVLRSQRGLRFPGRGADTELPGGDAETGGRGAAGAGRGSGARASGNGDVDDYFRGGGGTGGGADAGNGDGFDTGGGAGGGNGDGFDAGGGGAGGGSGDRFGAGGTGATGSDDAGAIGPETNVTEGRRDSGRDGFFREALDTVAPGDPNSFPLPLLILAAIALLLLGVGTAGVVARHFDVGRIRFWGK